MRKKRNRNCPRALIEARKGPTELIEREISRIQRWLGQVVRPKAYRGLLRWETIGRQKRGYGLPYRRGAHGPTFRYRITDQPGG